MKWRFFAVYLIFIFSFAFKAFWVKKTLSVFVVGMTGEKYFGINFGKKKSLCFFFSASLQN